MMTMRASLKPAIMIKNSNMRNGYSNKSNHITDNNYITCNTDKGDNDIRERNTKRV